MIATGIFIVILKVWHKRWRDIGFTAERFSRTALKDLASVRCSTHWDSRSNLQSLHFRGFFIKFLKEKYSEKKALFIAAFLFGLWHLVTPLRSVFDKEMTLAIFAVMSVGYVVLSALMGIKWDMLYEQSGSIWIGLADHFFNNCKRTW